MEPLKAGFLGWSSFTLWAGDSGTGARMSHKTTRLNIYSPNAGNMRWTQAGKDPAEDGEIRDWVLLPGWDLLGYSNVCMSPPARHSPWPLYRCVDTDTDHLFRQVMLCSAVNRLNWKPLCAGVNSDYLSCHIHWIRRLNYRFKPMWSQRWSHNNQLILNVSHATSLSFDFCLRVIQAIDTRQHACTCGFSSLTASLEWYLFPSAASPVETCYDRSASPHKSQRKLMNWTDRPPRWDQTEIKLPLSDSGNWDHLPSLRWQSTAAWKGTFLSGFLSDITQNLKPSWTFSCCGNCWSLKTSSCIRVFFRLNSEVDVSLFFFMWEFKIL